MRGDCIGTSAGITANFEKGLSYSGIAGQSGLGGKRRAAHPSRIRGLEAAIRFQFIGVVNASIIWPLRTL